MSKKDYSKDPSGRKQFSIDHIKFHDAEAAQDFFGCAKKYDAPTRAPLAEETIGDIPKRPSENPTAQFIGPFEPDTQPRNDTEACHRSGEKKEKIADAESAPRKPIVPQALTAIRTEAGQAVRTAPMTEATALPTTVPCRIRTICN